MMNYFHIRRMLRTLLLTKLNPVPESQSDFSQEDAGFPGLIDEVFKLLPSDMFPRKTEEFLGGNRPRSSIE